MIKQCAVCRQWIDTTLDARKWRGRNRKVCPACAYLRDKKYREGNADKRRQARARHYQENKEVLKGKSREYRRNNPNASRDQNLRNKYGITLEQKQALLKAQGGKCAVCGATKPGGKRDWCTDHDHETGKVRGVVCHRCNWAMQVKDNELWDKQLTNYKRRAECYCKNVGCSQSDRI